MVSKRIRKRTAYMRHLEAKEKIKYNELTDHELVVTVNRCIDILKMRLTRNEYINFNVTTKELSLIKSHTKPLESVTETYITEDDVLPFQKTLIKLKDTPMATPSIILAETAF